MPDGPISPFQVLVGEAPGRTLSRNRHSPDVSEDVLDELLEWLRRRTQAARVVLTFDDRERRAVRSSPWGSVTAKAGVPVARLAAPVNDGVVGCAVLTVELASPGDIAVMQDLIEFTAGCVGLELRNRRVAQEHKKWIERLTAATSAVEKARPLLAAVQAAERRRLDTVAQDTMRRPVARLLDVVDQLSDVLETPPQVGLSVLAELRQAIDDVFWHLRRLARGTSLVTLRDTGPAVALTELMEDLVHPVAVVGDVSVRAGWEIESALFWGVGAVVKHLDNWDGTGAGAMRVRWERTGGRLVAVVEVDRKANTGVAQHRNLAADIADEKLRIGALGGDVAVKVDGSMTTVTVWLPDSLEAYPTGTRNGSPAELG